MLPDFDPRHRIIGAIVLVSLAVIFLPMVLDSRALHEADAVPMFEIPERDKKIFVSKVTPIIPAGISTEAPQTAAKKSTSSPTPGTEKSKAITKPATKSASTPPPSTPAAAASSRKQARIKEGWAVRVGTFSVHENAERVMAALRAKGFTPNSSSIPTTNGAVTRVWLGPYKGEDEASRARQKVRSATGNDGYIVTYP